MIHKKPQVMAKELAKNHEYLSQLGDILIQGRHYNRGSMMTTVKTTYLQATVSSSINEKLNLHCSNCHIVIEEGGIYEDRVHYCALCMSGKCTTKYKEN